MIHFNVSRGAFLLKDTEGVVAALAQQYWMTSDMWLNREAISGNDLHSYHAFREALWALIIPYMTDMGNMEFRQLNALILQNLV